ncbi:MAG: hypothetical protein OXQ29_09795 [Rhodospirillaceae bacterium]|nr:hypothetical protein [Rhodospirillaceae bacterium]
MSTMIIGIAILATVTALAPGPAQAGWLDTLSTLHSVESTARTLKEHLDESLERAVNAMQASIKGDDAEVMRLSKELDEVPGRLIVNAFPVLQEANAVMNRVKSAREKISRFVSGAKEKAVDARAALAFDRNSASEARVMASPLPSPPLGNTFMNRGAAPSAPASASWSSVTGAGEAAGPPSGEAARVVAFALGCFKHKVDINDPDDYALWRVRMQRRLQAGGSLDCAEVRDEGMKVGTKDAADAGSGEAKGGSAGENAVSAWLGEGRKQGTAQPGWDEVMGDNRNAQASVPGTAGHAASGDSGTSSDYALALQRAVGTAPGSDGGYLSALVALDEREAEWRRLQEEENARQNALNEESEQEAAISDFSYSSERQRQAAPDSQPHPACEEYLAAIDCFFKTQGQYALASYDGEDFSQTVVSAAYAQLRSASIEVNVDFTESLSVAMDTWYTQATGSSVADAKGKVWTATEASRSAFLEHGGKCI